jgi:GNAT superfamily N-acetyltransferase
MNNDIILRPAAAEDINFIMSSWKQSWRTCPWAGVIRNDQYYDVMRDTIEGLVGREATFQVACLASRPDRILGWACSEKLADGLCCIHYVYVKDPYLRMGIGEQLVDSAAGTKPGLYTFHTRQVTEACQGWRHAPEVARRK